MTALLALLSLDATAATYRAEVDATPSTVPGDVVHVSMTLHWLEESMPVPPVLCVATPPGWRPERVMGDLRSRRGRAKVKPMQVGGLPEDQLDPLEDGGAWACVVGSGRNWRQGATGSVVFTLRVPEDASGTYRLPTAVGRFDRSVHIGTTPSVTVAPDHAPPGTVGLDPALARRVFDALDHAENLSIEASSLAGQLTVRQPPPVEKRVMLAERVWDHQSGSLALLVGPTDVALGGYDDAWNARRDEARATVHDAASTWLTRTCDHKQRLLAEPPSQAHDARLAELQQELEQLVPALEPWWTEEERSSATTCVALQERTPPEEPAPAPEAASEAATAPSPR